MSMQVDKGQNITAIVVSQALSTFFWVCVWLRVYSNTKNPNTGSYVYTAIIYQGDAVELSDWAISPVLPLFSYLSSVELVKILG